jgi:Spy/CpxP family protein refolding chaperone
MFRPLFLMSILCIQALPSFAQAEEGRPLARFRMEQLQQSTGLPEEQARAIVDRWARYDREQFEKSQQLHQIRQRFNDILLGPGSEEEKNAKVRPLLDQFVELRRQQADLKFRFEDDIRGRLTPAQQVRLILQVEELQRRVADALHRGAAERPGLGGGLRQGGIGGGIRRGGR